MPVRSGVAAQLGIATEVTWGTYVAPATFLPFTSESLRLEKEYIRTAGLRAGRLAQSEALHVATTKSVAGGVSIDVLQKGMGKLLNLLHGNTVVPAQIAATTAYRQTHDIGTTDPFGKSLTIQVGRPDVGGTVRSFSYLGSKATQATFSLERGGVLTAEWEFDGKDEDTGQSLGAATYAAASIPFSFQSGNIEIDDVVLTDCIQSATVTVAIPQATDRYCISSSQTKKEPIQNGLVEITMDLEAEFASLTQHTAFVNATRRKVELICSQGDAGGSNPFKFAFTAAKTITTGAGPVVEGPDILTQALSVEVVDDGATAPLSIEVVSTDLTL